MTNRKIVLASLFSLCLAFLVLSQPDHGPTQTSCRVYCPDGSSHVQSCASSNDPCSSSGGSGSSGDGFSALGEALGDVIWMGLGKLFGLLVPDPEKSAPARPDPRIEARAANEDGVKAFNSGDYARAESLFEQALQGWPDDATIARNLRNARERQSAQREEQARRAATQASLDRLTGVLSNMQPAASTGLDFYPATASGTATSPAGGLDFLPASGAAHQQTMSGPLTPFPLGSVSPDIGLGAGANVAPLPRPRDANFGGGTAREQLEAAAGHGDIAAGRGQPGAGMPTREAASDTARQVFDTPGARVPPLAVKPPDTPPSKPVAESAAPKPPKVVELERNLEENRVKREKIEKEIEQLKNEPATPEKLVEISKKKDDLGRAEQERDFFKFEITQAQVDNSGGSPAAPQDQAGNEAR